MRILLAPSVVHFGEQRAVTALVEVESAAERGLIPARRLLDLAIVIDRSGSMSLKLEDAKECAALLIGLLTPEDRISVITCGVEAEVVCSAAGPDSSLSNLLGRSPRGTPGDWGHADSGQDQH